MKNIELVIKKSEEKVLPIIWVDDTETEINVSVQLLAENASVTIVGIFFGSLTTSVIFNTDVIHKGKNTRSLTFIRVVCKDTAGFTNDGMVRIVKGTKNANGYFSSKVLLLDDAKGRSVPSLEIDENEVKAGHASTIGRPDKEQLFYLRSRGLSEEDAQKLIVSGFFDPAMQFLSEYDRKLAEKKLRQKLHTL